MRKGKAIPGSIRRPMRSSATCAVSVNRFRLHRFRASAVFLEWSTSYTPRDSVHDPYISAPYILTKLKACQGLVQGMSYGLTPIFSRNPDLPLPRFKEDSDF